MCAQITAAQSIIDSNTRSLDMLRKQWRVHQHQRRRSSAASAPAQLGAA
jgi:hypothetical protein